MEFYATCAQVIPVLVLTAAVERVAGAGFARWRGWTLWLLFGSAGISEFLCLFALARDKEYPIWVEGFIIVVSLLFFGAIGDAGYRAVRDSRKIL